MKIYLDQLRQKHIQSELYENTIYYLDFESATVEKITEEINKAGLGNFIDWQFGNRYAKLNVTNYIGSLYFFDQNFDLKSSKFLIHLTGREQFQLILSDLQNRSRNLTFSYQSPSISIRQTDFSVLNPDVLMQFNYYKQIILDWPQHKNLYSDFEKILKKPHFKYENFYIDTNVTRVNKISNKTVRKLVSQQSNLTFIESTSQLSSLPISKFLSQNSQANYFPTKLYTKQNSLTIDTNENRFIKFFFEHVQNITNRLNSFPNLPSTILNEQKKVLLVCRQILSNNFFKDIGILSYIPQNSTILSSRSGYKEIFEHYTRSRFGIRSILQEFESELLSQGLKKISDLYEYWVFFIIAEAFLGSEIIIEQQDVVLSSGKISYGICFKANDVSVYYNWTESREKKTSYSLTLRPDTTVEIRMGNKKVKFIFDAKYKVQSSSSENDISRYVKSEDIYKMHTYLDAISNVEFAMVVYPGTEFYFYEKTSISYIKRSIEDVSSFKGVGAIPLIPSDSNSELNLKAFVEKVKSFFSIMK